MHHCPHVLRCFVSIHREHIHIFGIVVLLSFSGSKHKVDGESERIVNHAGYQSLQEGTRLVEARVCVNLNEVGLKLRVNQEIVSEQVEAPFARFERRLNRLHRRRDLLLHSSCQLILHEVGGTLFASVFIEVTLQLVKGELVSVLMLAVVFKFLLYCVVSQMDFRPCY
jgi:hypothetical protein